MLNKINKIIVDALEPLMKKYPFRFTKTQQRDLML